MYREGLRVFFEPELRYLDVAQGASGLGRDEDSVYKTMRGIMLGTSKEKMDHPISNIYNTIDDAYDRLMKAAWDKANNVTNQKKTRERVGAEEFVKLTERYGETHRPFSTLKSTLRTLQRSQCQVHSENTPLL